MARVRRVRAWFRAFRRTRPFWGAVVLALGGLEVLYFASADLQVAIAAGFVGTGAWIIAGGMVLCGALAVVAPSQRMTLGLFGTLLSISSLVASNFGGFLVGMALGVLGGTAVMAWGPKKPRVRLEAA